MIRINLLSVKETERALGRRQQNSLILLGGIVLLAAMVLPTLMQIRRLSGLERQVQEVEREISRYNEQVKEVENLEKLNLELKSKISVIEELEKKRVGPARVLADLSVATPEKLWLVEFSETGGGAKITGVALDEETVSVFMRQLKASPYFYNVDLDEVVQQAKQQSKQTAKTAAAPGMDFRYFTIRTSIDYFGEGGRSKKVEPKPEAAESGKAQGKGPKGGKGGKGAKPAASAPGGH